jgi:hypothetical protein
MSVIRFRKGQNPLTTPTGTSKLWVDESDNHLKRTLDNGDVIDYDASNSIEAIQDAIGQSLTDTATIDLNYNDVADEITANIVPESINSSHVYQISPTKIGDLNSTRYKATLNTTTASFATAFVLDASSDSTIMVQTVTTCTRTGGLAGSPGDGAAFKRTFRVKSIGGVVSILDMQSDYTSRDDAGMRVEYVVSGTDILFRVGGLTNNNLRWVLEITTSNN